VPFGRWHALRTGRDFVAGLSDRRHRQPTVCGAFARPSRLLPHRTGHQFVTASPDACRTCTELISPPLDPLAPPTIERAASPGRRTEHMNDLDEWFQRLDPTHPIRRHPERYGLLTKQWLRTTSLTSRRTNDPPR
jgi:hypothetical protein